MIQGIRCSSCLSLLCIEQCMLHVVTHFLMLDQVVEVIQFYLNAGYSIFGLLFLKPKENRGCCVWVFFFFFLGLPVSNREIL